MKSFKEFYEEAVNFSDILNKIVSKIKGDRREKLSDPRIQKKAQESMARLKRLLQDYKTDIREAKPERYYGYDPEIYGPDDEVPQNPPNVRMSTKATTPEEKEERRRELNRQRRKAEQEYMFSRPKGTFSYHAMPEDRDEKPYINLAQSDVDTIASKKIDDAFIRELFLLAHETGHALQYGDPATTDDRDLNQDLEYAMNMMRRTIPQKDLKLPDYLDFVNHFAHAYMELMAWERGGHFIPEELKDDYHNYAKSAYTSYLARRDIEEYLAQPLIKDLLNKFEYDRYQESYKKKGTLLLEGFQEVPRKFLKVHTDIKNLPNKPPYGFWVDRSGNFIPVKFLGHNDSAMDIIKRAKKWKEKHGDTGSLGGNVKDVMYLDGWLRLRYDDRDRTMYYTSAGRGQPLTISQKKFLDYIKDLYDMKEVKMDPFM